MTHDNQQDLKLIAGKYSCEKNDRINSKLQNAGFLSKAPEQVVNAERERAAKLEQMLAQLADSRARLEKLKK